MLFYNYCEFKFAVIVLAFGICLCDRGDFFQDKFRNSSQDMELASVTKPPVSYKSVQNPNNKNLHDNYYFNNYPSSRPYNGGYPLRRDSYLEAASSGYSYPPSQPNLAGVYHYKIIPEPEMEEECVSNTGYGYSRTDSKHKCKSKGKGGLHGLWGLFGLFGLKGLASLLLPFLLGALFLIPFIPIPVVTLPVQGGRSIKMDYAGQQIIDNVLSDEENCVERISCEISNRLQRKSMKFRNLKAVTKSMDEWLHTNNATDPSSDRASMLHDSARTFLRKLIKGINQGIGKEGRSESSCSIYEKCRILESIKKFYTTFLIKKMDASEKFDPKIDRK